MLRAIRIIGLMEQRLEEIRRMSMHRMLVFVIAGLLLAVACSGGAKERQDVTPTATETVTVTSTPEERGEVSDGSLSGPLDLQVALDDAIVTAGIGSYCWGSACVDAVGLITPPVALVGLSQSPLVAQLPDVPLREATARAWSLDARSCDPIWQGGQGTLACDALRVAGSVAWPSDRLGEGRELPVRVEGDTLRVVWSLLQPGLYVVSLELLFEGDGRDVTYGVLLAVLPSEG